MKVGEVVLLAAVCCLLALATTAARAEYVWVLWGQSQDPWGALLNVRLGAWPSREACEQQRSDREKEPPPLRMASYSCLPGPVEKHER